MLQEDDAILLKIKRQFSKEESISCLLKIISDLEIENGSLKSEIFELEHKIEKIRSGDKKTKKQWLQEEIFEELNKELKLLTQTNHKNKTSMLEWRKQYFNLLAKYDKQ